MATPLGSWVSSVNLGLRANTDIRTYTLRMLAREVAEENVRVMGSGVDATPTEVAFALARLIGREIECRLVCECTLGGQREFVTSSRDVEVLLAAISPGSVFVLDLQELEHHNVAVFDANDGVRGAMFPMRHTFNPDAISQWGDQFEVGEANPHPGKARVLAETWSSAMRDATLRFMTVYL